MSQKKAKEARKQAAIPTAVHQITISLMNNGTVNVSGFPMSYPVALQMMLDGQRAIVGWFMKAAKEGRMNDQMVVDGSNILVPDKKLVRIQ
jgi:hypothetical protein